MTKTLDDLEKEGFVELAHFKDIKLLRAGRRVIIYDPNWDKIVADYEINKGREEYIKDEKTNI